MKFCSSFYYSLSSCIWQLTPRAANPSILQQLNHKDFITTQDVLCEQFLRAATRSRRVITVCNNILATIPTKQDGQRSDQEEGIWITSSERSALQQYFQTLHTHTWSKMQQQIGQLLEARADLHAQLPVAELRQVWDHCMDFVGVAGRIYGTKGKLLLSTLLRQARDSLEFMHKNQLVHLQSLLHEELWKPALVSSTLQNEISSLQDNPRVRFIPLLMHSSLCVDSRPFCTDRCRWRDQCSTSPSHRQSLVLCNSLFAGVSEDALQLLVVCSLLPGPRAGGHASRVGFIQVV